MSSNYVEQILSHQPVEGMKKFSISVLLVDDQVIIAEAIRRMLTDQPDIVLHYCNNPANAIQMAKEVQPTVILQDLVMPDVDGLMLVRYFRANTGTCEVPLIVLSAKEEPKIKAEAFALGANDYMVKLPDKVELIARIRYHSAAYIRLLERNQAYRRLEENQKILNAELAEAAAYVKSLLPKPMQNGIKTSWRFIPSTHLGGDAFGYHWLDSDHFALYLLDVCGHGVGAALLSISVINVLRSQTLSKVNFLNPSQVLESLNESFQMENHNNMFFTIWYGVYNNRQREITYSSGGHPPAILFTGATSDKMKCVELKTYGMAIGVTPGAKFQSATYKVDKANKLYLFSDGVYELTKPDGSIVTLGEFTDVLKKIPSLEGMEDLDRILQYSQNVNGSTSFADDFSLLEVIFNP
jgi:phosphoserine phosphatase RsbU/P